MRERANRASILIGRDEMSERMKGVEALRAKYIVSSGLRKRRAQSDAQLHMEPCKSIRRNLKKLNEI